MESASAMQAKKKVLCFFDYFYPAFMSGGPARSSLGIVEYLSPYYDLNLITRDRDTYDKRPMQGITPNEWNEVKGIRAFYLQMTRYWTMIKVLRTTPSDIYYFNSFFSLKFTVVPLAWVRLFTQTKSRAIVAPRGELSPGAVRLKGFKKRLFIKIFGRLYSGVTFHASSEQESKDIAFFFPDSEISVALNLRPKSEFHALQYIRPGKKEGELRIVYLSRIDRKKNLDFVLKAMEQSTAKVIFDIYGIVDDPAYWQSCQALIEKLNIRQNLKIEYKGKVSPDQTFAIISQYDLMMFTSLGENFSHAILESFMASRPVLVSDATYWRGLESKAAGWDFPLSDLHVFSSKIDELAPLNNENFEKYCLGAYDVAVEYFSNPARVGDYRNLLG